MAMDSFMDMEKLNNKEREQVRAYIESLKRSKIKQGNEECIYWKRGCNNQICPMLKDKSKLIWYSDEDVCNNPDYKNELTVINQKKLKKKNAKGYFTYEMLNRNFIIKKGIEGIDPDVPSSIDLKGQKAVDKLYADREKAWFNSHLGLTYDQIKRKRITGMKNIEALKRHSEVKKNNAD